MDFFNKNFYPENFILIGQPDEQKKTAEKIISEATDNFSEKFEGEQPSFSFELRYVPPFDKNFSELKRLQVKAAQTAGKRRDFKGYIVIDVSNYLEHEKENYFLITMRFLADMSENWKYIFYADNKNRSACEALVRSMLGVLLQDVTCEIREDICPKQDDIDSICEECGVICSEPAKKILKEMMLSNDELGRDIISSFIRDVSGCFGNKLMGTSFKRFLRTREPSIKYMMTPKQYERFIDLFKEGSDKSYEHKEKI